MKRSQTGKNWGGKISLSGFSVWRTSRSIIRKKSWDAAYENAGDKITELVQKTPGIVAFVPQKFIVRPDAVHFIKDNTISVKDVFAGAEWFPTATPAAQFGFLPLITGTLWVSLFAISFCFAVRTFGFDLYVRGGQSESTELAETDYRAAERYSFRWFMAFSG